jgi:hypothetical protein
MGEQIQNDSATDERKRPQFQRGSQRVSPMGEQIQNDSATDEPMRPRTQKDFQRVSPTGSAKVLAMAGTVPSAH